MTSSQQAKQAAQQWATAAGFDGDIRGKMLIVPVFAEDADAEFYLPGRNATFHRMIVQAVQRDARRRGAKVVPVHLYPRDYRAWLRAEGLADTTDLRAEYFRAQTKLV